MPFDHRALSIRYRPKETMAILPRGVPALPPNADWRVSALHRFISDLNGSLGHKLDEICAQLDLGITASHIARLFRQQVGLGFREFHKLTRLRHAAHQLRNTSLLVKEITAELGYRSPADFHRQFKQMFGMTPRRFRAVQRPRAPIPRLSA